LLVSIRKITADLAAARGVSGLLTKPSLGLSKIFSYRAFERTLVGSVEPRSVLELALVHRLASLLWRLRRASAIETGLFDIKAEFLLAPGQTPPADPVNRGRRKLPLTSMVTR